jgi:hypothetical protein
MLHTLALLHHTLNTLVLHTHTYVHMPSMPADHTGASDNNTADQQSRRWNVATRQCRRGNSLGNSYDSMGTVCRKYWSC